MVGRPLLALLVCSICACEGAAHTGGDSEAGTDVHEAFTQDRTSSAPPGRGLHQDGTFPALPGRGLHLAAPGPAPDDALLPAQSDELSARARHLLEAIAQDDATLADDLLFPRDGWLVTRDVADGGKDWDKRVAQPFRRAVHALSRRKLQPDQPQAVSLELGRAVVQGTPRRHGWKKPLWTVSGSQLTFVVNGHTRTLSIREMVAWRGAWYVTRLR
jgi:hypothetical protein